MKREARVAGIILAAGASSRMGTPKALLRVGSDAFITLAARSLLGAGASPVAAVVAGDIEAAVRLELTAVMPPVDVVRNPHRERGQLSSLLVGLDAVDQSDVDAVLVSLVDCPLVRIDTIVRVIAAYRATRAPVVRPAAGGRHGHPVLFSRAVFDELRRTDLSVGAKAVVRAHAAAAVDVEVSDAGAFADIDTPDDYARCVR